MTELDTGCILHCQTDAHVMPFTRYSKPAVPLLFASRCTFQDRNSSRSTIVALKPKARMCIFGCFYLTIFFKLLVFYRITRSRIIFRILNSLLMTAVLTMEGI